MIVALELLSVLALARTMLATRGPREHIQGVHPGGKPRFRFSIDCVTVLYLVSRLVILHWLAVHTDHKTDVNFYHRTVLRMFSGEIPYKDFLFQYPPLSLVLIGIPGIIWKLIGEHVPLTYAMCYRLLMCLFDAVTYLLVRREAERRGRLEFVIYYIAASSIFAFILFDRLDVAIALFGFYAVTGSADAGQSFRRAFAVGVGTLVKLTPICLLPVLLFDQLAANRTKRDLLKIIAYATVPVGIGFLLVTLLSPRSDLPFIAYHEVRGIEVESTWSSLIILLHLMRIGWFDNLSVQLNASSQSSDLVGRECDALAGIINWIMIVFLVACTLLLYWRRQCRMHNRPFFFGAFILISFIICGKVFSPQYMIWLVPIAPFAFSELSRVGRIAAFSFFFIACALTTAIFPALMVDLVSLQSVAAVVLAVRNGMVIFIWALMAHRLIKDTSLGAAKT